jgi:hypothetical protein
MKITEFASLLGGTVNGRWINIRGPGHTSKDDSLGVMFDPSATDGFRINSFAGDDPAKCRRYVKSLLELKKPNGCEFEPRQCRGAEVDERLRRALALWEHANPAEGTLVEKYLNSRACSLTSVLKSADVLRFHPFCRFGNDQVPAMVALMRHVITDEPTGIHRTALTRDGRKHQELAGGAKRMWGTSAQAAVKLSQHDGVLGIAEGIETALSAQTIFAIPVWACLSATGVGGFPIINGLNHLTIFADQDTVGITVARKCARKYHKAGIEVEIRCPPAAGDKCERASVV